MGVNVFEALGAKVSSVIGVASAVNNARGGPLTPQLTTGRAPSVEYDMHRVNPNYMVTFYQPSTQTIVNAPAPEEFDITIGSEYNAPFAEFALGGSGFQMMAKALGFKVSANIASMQVWDGSSPIDVTLPLKFVAVRNSYADVVMPLQMLARLCVPSVSGGIVGNGQFTLGFIESPGPNIDISLPKVLDGVRQFLGQLGNGISNVASAATKESGNVATAASDAAAGAVAGGAQLAQDLFSAVGISNNIGVMIGNYSYFPSVVVTSVQMNHASKFDVYGIPIEVTATVQFRTFVNPTKADVHNYIGLHKMGWDSDRLRGGMSQAEEEAYLQSAGRNKLPELASSTGGTETPTAGGRSSPSLVQTVVGNVAKALA